MLRHYAVLFMSFSILLTTGVSAMTAQNLDLLQNPNARQLTSLNGQWDIIPDPYENGYYNHRYEAKDDGYFLAETAKTPSDLIEYNFDKAQKLQVPGDWNSQDDKLFFYEGTVWYHKPFTLTPQQDKTYLLHFAAVNYHAIVYVNGHRVGEHVGGFTPFEFDVSQHLRAGHNFVVVKVDNRRERHQIPTVNTDWWNYGGITRSVSLITLDKIHVRDYQIALSAGRYDQITLNLSVAGNTDKAHITIPELGVKQAIAIDEQGQGKVVISATPTLWSPSSPKLYDIQLRAGSELISDKIGFRHISTQTEDILLNGQAIFLKGIAIHEESFLHAGRAWSEADARATLQAALDLGCNFVRLAHYPHNESMLRMADEMGLLVWAEIPVYWTVLFAEPAVYLLAEQQLSDMISRDKNRAAIILWSVANETPQGAERLNFLTKLATHARTLDPSRLITAALDTQSNSATGKLIDDPLAAVVDIIGINSYCGWYGGTPQSCGQIQWQSEYHKPMIMSELGAGALQGLHGEAGQRWTEEYQAEVYRNNLKMIDNISFLRGLTPWILKDFRSPRRPLVQIQDFWNRKGLLSETGEKKQAWQVLHDYYQHK
jgi:beta-glucuronidase